MKIVQIILSDRPNGVTIKLECQYPATMNYTIDTPAGRHTSRLAVSNIHTMTYRVWNTAYPNRERLLASGELEPDYFALSNAIQLFL